MDVTGAVGEGSEGNKLHIIENRRKGYPDAIVAGILAELPSAAMWKTKLLSDYIDYLAAEISNKEMMKQSGFFVLLIVKCKEEIKGEKND